MPRPAVPLLNRGDVIATAVRIIDAEGLAACSLPRLAHEFGVRTPSLYHHFADRSEINAEIARYIVNETVVPRRYRNQNWVEWFVKLSCNFRKTILCHPQAAPLLLEHVPREVLSPLYDDASQYLTDSGIPYSMQVLILDGLENLTLGAALTQAMKPAPNHSTIFPHFDRSSERSLAFAVDRNEWKTMEKLFAEKIRRFLLGATSEVHFSDAGSRTTEGN